MIPAISLWQPWASAIALGAKKIETRSWGTGHRGAIAIHAAKKWTGELADDARFFARTHPQELRSLAELTLKNKPPLGVIVCVAELVDCVRMTEAWIEEQTALERHLGGYEPGRWGWILKNVRPLTVPLAVRGRQGLWSLSGEELELVLAAAIGTETL